MLRFLGTILVLSLPVAFADQITLADFVSPTVEDYSGLAGIFTGDTSNCGGILCVATPVVINGDTYNTSANDNHFLRYLDSTNSNNLVCVNGDGACLNTNSDLGFIDVTLATPMLRVGAFANTFGHFTVEFFAPDNSSLGSVDATSSAFVAWQDAGGIARIRVTDTAQINTSMIFDDLTFEGPIATTGAVPEPVCGVLLGFLVLSAGVARRFARKSV